MYVRLPACQFVCLSASLPIGLSAYPPACLPVRYLPACLPVCLSACNNQELSDQQSCPSINITAVADYHI
jgi:hypothetical protein